MTIIRGPEAGPASVASVSYIHGMSRSRSVRALCAAACLALVAGACSSGGPGATTTSSSSSRATSRPTTSPGEASAFTFDPTRVRVALRPVARGLEAPLYVTGAGDGSERLFVVEQGGTIRIVEDGKVVPAPFLDISSRITSGGEQGLLGLAFHPNYEDDGRFYVDYTDRLGDTVVAEYRVDPANPNRADPSSERVLLHVTQPFANHNGGDVAFGPDGDLYVAFGDGGSGGDPMGNGQNLDTLLGKLLRIDVDHPSGGRPYGIPADNPFAKRSGARPEIWAFGLRNPWRFSFDRLTHDLWIGDVGQGEHEEIDHVPAGAGGQNFGWNIMEGPACFEPSTGCDRSGLTLPVASYTHAEGNCTVIGGYVYRGSAFRILRGGYLYADFCAGKVWLLDAQHPRQRSVEVLDVPHFVSSFGEDDEGELYLTALDSGDVFQVTGRPA
jgi:glucose/arabinose dehydrogenase